MAPSPVGNIYTTLPALLARTPRPVIIEAGAHYAQDTQYLRQTFPDATIFAFEPDPRNTYRIRRDGLWGIARFVEAAVGDHDGTAIFHLSSGIPPKGDPQYFKGQPIEPWTYSSSLKRPVKHLTNVPWVKFEQTATVKVVRLDTFAQRENLASIDFIWADVQGAEDQLIAGGQATLARTRYLYTEYGNEEIYAGQLSLREIVARLPGKWEVVADYGDDALLSNTAFPA
jgi:FkbM family methyltransferase